MTICIDEYWPHLKWDRFYPSCKLNGLGNEAGLFTFKGSFGWDMHPQPKYIKKLYIYIYICVCVRARTRTCVCVFFRISLSFSLSLKVSLRTTTMPLLQTHYWFRFLFCHLSHSKTLYQFSYQTWVTTLEHFINVVFKVL